MRCHKEDQQTRWTHLWVGLPFLIQVLQWSRLFENSNKNQIFCWDSISVIVCSTIRFQGKTWSKSTKLSKTCSLILSNSLPNSIRTSRGRMRWGRLRRSRRDLLSIWELGRRTRRWSKMSGKVSIMQIMSCMSKFVWKDKIMRIWWSRGDHLLCRVGLKVEKRLNNRKGIEESLSKTSETVEFKPLGRIKSKKCLICSEKVNKSESFTKQCQAETLV